MNRADRKIEFCVILISLILTAACGIPNGKPPAAEARRLPDGLAASALTNATVDDGQVNAMGYGDYCCRQGNGLYFTRFAGKTDDDGNELTELCRFDLKTEGFTVMSSPIVTDCFTVLGDDLYYNDASINNHPLMRRPLSGGGAPEKLMSYVEDGLIVPEEGRIYDGWSKQHPDLNGNQKRVDYFLLSWYALGSGNMTTISEGVMSDTAFSYDNGLFYTPFLSYVAWDNDTYNATETENELYVISSDGSSVSTGLFLKGGEWQVRNGVLYDSYTDDHGIIHRTRQSLSGNPAQEYLSYDGNGVHYAFMDEENNRFVITTGTTEVFSVYAIDLETGSKSTLLENCTFGQSYTAQRYMSGWLLFFNNSCADVMLNIDTQKIIEF